MPSLKIPGRITSFFLKPRALKNIVSPGVLVMLYIPVFSLRAPLLSFNETTPTFDRVLFSSSVMIPLTWKNLSVS